MGFWTGLETLYMTEYIVDDGSRSMTSSFDLGGNNILNAGNIELDSLTKDGAGTIAVNDDLDLNGNAIDSAAGISASSTFANTAHYVNLSTTDLLINSNSVNNQVQVTIGGTGYWQVATDSNGNGTFTTYFDAGPDSFSITGDLWRSSTTADELKWNDGAVVQLS